MLISMKFKEQQQQTKLDLRAKIADIITGNKTTSYKRRYIVYN